MRAIGVNAIAASLEVTIVDSSRPVAADDIAVTTNVSNCTPNAIGPPEKPSAKNAIARSTVH